MFLEPNHLVYFIIISWTSCGITGDIITINDHWESEVQRCRHGDEYRSRTYTIRNQTISNLNYNFFNDDTVVIAVGKILIKCSTPKAIETTNLLLNEYKEDFDAKVYVGQLRMESELTSDTQVAHVEIELRIPREGPATIKNYVYAGRWGNTNIAIRALSYIYNLRIAN